MTLTIVDLQQRRWQVSNQVAGDQRHLPEFSRRQVAGQPVHVDAQVCRIQRRKALADQSGDNARQYMMDLQIANDEIIGLSHGDRSGSAVPNYTIQLLKTDIDGNQLWAKDYQIVNGNDRHTGDLDFVHRHPGLCVCRKLGIRQLRQHLPRQLVQRIAAVLFALFGLMSLVGLADELGIWGS